MRIDVLEVFAEAQGLAIRSAWTEVGGLEASRRWWRIRQAERGECRSCRRPALAGLRYCVVHKSKNNARARRWLEDNREKNRLRCRAWRARQK